MKTTAQLRKELLEIFPVAEDNDWELAFKFMKAFEREDFEICALIRREVNFRIKTGRINDKLMNGMRFYNRKTNQYEGPANTSQFNGLFDEYFNAKGIDTC